MTPKFILRASPGAAPDAAALAEHLRERCKIRVIDQSPRMLLVDATHGSLTAALDGSNGWAMIPESTTPLPDIQPRVKRSAAAGSRRSE